jgi:hypothetical protein
MCRLRVGTLTLRRGEWDRKEKEGKRCRRSTPALMTLNFNALLLLGIYEPLAVKERLGETRDEERERKHEEKARENATKVAL